VFEIGGALREARLRRGLDYAQVEAELRIRARYLAALEQERFELLPGDAYAKGFLRGYAEFLGLDGNLFVEEYNARAHDDEQPLPPVELEPVRHPLRPRRRPRVLLGLAIAAAAVTGLLILGLVHGGSHPKHTLAPTRPVSSAPAPTRRRPAPSPPKRPRPLVRVGVHAIGAWDPYGDRREHDSEAGFATDAKPATFWRTETYTDGLQKPGVGLLLDAGRAVRLRRLLVATDTPGYTAVVEAGASASGPFRPISPTRTTSATTTFPLQGGAQRYYLLWIVRLDHVGHVNEVGAFA
jgi:transcriptional regulator with XRE-family HTH domain